MIKAITFDLDDTLWAVDPVIQHANRTLWEWLHVHAPAMTAQFVLEDLNEGSRLRAGILQRHPQIAHSMTQIRLRLLHECLLQSGYSDADAEVLANNAFDAFIEARHEVELFAHARSMLEKLKQQGMILGALSNGNAEVSRTGLADLFDFQFNADQVGAAKPHPLMFQKALEYLNIQPEEVVHVGDHPVNDIQAAAQLGFWTIWVNLDAGPWPGGRPADAEVTSLEHLPAAVTAIQAMKATNSQEACV
ncbi:MAG: HAD family hydrolase [Nitrincola lacisaponensis]|uniref:HAD family hydrolase n=1 Tax=Nitrincola lacisaponensis TaxID=267850 RepID=UPI00391D63A9